MQGERFVTKSDKIRFLAGAACLSPLLLGAVAQSNAGAQTPQAAAGQSASIEVAEAPFAPRSHHAEPRE
jgi:hypothetical protein